MSPSERPALPGSDLPGSPPSGSDLPEAPARIFWSIPEYRLTAHQRLGIVRDVARNPLLPGKTRVMLQSFTQGVRIRRADGMVEREQARRSGTPALPLLEVTNLPGRITSPSGLAMMGSGATAATMTAMLLAFKVRMRTLSCVHMFEGPATRDQLALMLSALHDGRGFEDLGLGPHKAEPAEMLILEGLSILDHDGPLPSWPGCRVSDPLPFSRLLGRAQRRIAERKEERRASIARSSC